MAIIAAPAFAGDDKKSDPSQIGDRNVGKCLNFYSQEQEMALGKQLAQEVAREAKVVDEPILSEYVNRIGQNLARHSDAKFPFTFRVIENDAPNAFALPGGYIFVHSGLIGIASEEDEFAAAVAHEIAHVAARHLTCRDSKEKLANAGTVPLSILLGGWTGLAAREAARAAIPMSFLSFSRHDETEADFLGVQYMWAAGYDPTGAISIFEKLESLQKTQPSAMGKLLSTHPMDSDRITKTQAEIDTILPAKPDYIVTTSEYANMRERLLKMESSHKPADATKPQLRRAPEVDETGNSADDSRPTLKRHDPTQ